MVDPWENSKNPPSSAANPGFVRKKKRYLPWRASNHLTMLASSRNWSRILRGNFSFSSMFAPAKSHQFRRPQGTNQLRWVIGMLKKERPTCHEQLWYDGLRCSLSKPAKMQRTHYVDVGHKRQNGSQTISVSICGSWTHDVVSEWVQEVRVAPSLCRGSFLVWRSRIFTRFKLLYPGYCTQVAPLSEHRLLRLLLLAPVIAPLSILSFSCVFHVSEMVIFMFNFIYSGRGGVG